ncbi:MAG TPA: SRPBCC family protein [Nitrospiraceae bacterium]|nr:SRPBCC family protein [Nitrospiraceae bacterium]
MTTIVRSIDVNVPVRTAYNQWIRFDEFPQFMEGVKQVTQMDANRLHWKAEIAGQENEWVAKIIEQTPEKRIAWTSRDGVLHGAMVTFHPLSDAQSKILLRVGRITGRGVANVGEALDALSLRAQGDLERFKVFIEARGHRIGAWQEQV